MTTYDPKTGTLELGYLLGVSQRPGWLPGHDFPLSPADVVVTERTRPRLHLQGVGTAPAKPAGELQVGDTIMWNYGYTYVVEWIELCGAQSLRVTERSTLDGRSFTRTLRRHRLVAVID